jgi:hypothetical protein
MKAYWGSESMAPRIPDLGTIWRWMTNFTSRPLYPQSKRQWYPLDRRLGGLQSRSEHGGKEKYSNLLPGFEPPIIQPVAQRYTIELSWLFEETVCSMMMIWIVPADGSCQCTWHRFHPTVSFIIFCKGKDKGEVVPVL